MNRRTVLSIALMALLGVASAFAQVPGEAKAEVKELTAFHSVIFPLWHTAWPNKDMALMRELLPKVKDQVAALQKATLPGILRDKQAKWEEGVRGIVDASTAYEQALAANQPQPALDAVEKLHGTYEGLVRLIRPPMKEFDAYHQVLYQVYHRDWPEKKLDALKTNATELATRCQALQSAALPQRLATREATLKTGFAALCASTTALVEASTKTDPAVIGKAVDKLHSDYQTVEKLFEQP